MKNEAVGKFEAIGSLTENTVINFSDTKRKINQA